MHGIRQRVITGASIFAIALILLGGGVSGQPARAQAATLTPAPEFAGITHWINSGPLTMRSLRGKVVLVDFWAYSCINCLRTLPHVIGWYNQYKNKGFVVVGVHSPEFQFGKHLDNVERAVKHFHIGYPVAMDSHMTTWNAWNNQFWPAEYLVNRKGQVVLEHVGEGNYLAMENAIREQLGLPPTRHAETPGPDFSAMGSPEMYFGSAREQYQANAEGPSPTPHDYHLPSMLRLNQFALGGRWQMTPQYAQLVGNRGEVRLHFESAKLYMVAASDRPVTLQVTVDGRRQPPVIVQASKLYTLFDSRDYARHTVTIDVPRAGLRAFTFTFG